MVFTETCLLKPSFRAVRVYGIIETKLYRVFQKLHISQQNHLQDDVIFAKIPRFKSDKNVRYKALPTDKFLKTKRK